MNQWFNSIIIFIIGALLGIAFLVETMHQNYIQEEMDLVDPIIETFTSYEDVTDKSTDRYDIHVHETNESKEIEFHPKKIKSSGIKLTNTWATRDHYYRIKPDLSYRSVSKEETSFDTAERRN